MNEEYFLSEKSKNLLTENDDYKGYRPITRKSLRPNIYWATFTPNRKA